MEQVKRVTPDKKLFENIFLNREDEEIIQLISEGISAVINNAENLYYDAQLMFKNSRWASWRFLLTVRVKDIVNTFWHEFYLVVGSGHREHFDSKHAKKLVFSRILDDFCCAQNLSSTIWFTMS